MRISDWSSDVCSSDLLEDIINVLIEELVRQKFELPGFTQLVRAARAARNAVNTAIFKSITEQLSAEQRQMLDDLILQRRGVTLWDQLKREPKRPRSEEHTSELQSLMRISYAVFCLKKKTQKITNYNWPTTLLFTTNVNTYTNKKQPYNPSHI